MSRHTTVGAIATILLIAACGGTDQLPPSSPEPVRVLVPAPPAPAPPAPAPPAPPAVNDPLVGEYSLDLSLGSGCAVMPDSVRRQRFSASIQPATSGYVVTLGGTNFLSGWICTSATSGLGCNQFIASQDGESVRFDLVNDNDNGHGGHLDTQVSDGTWVELIGYAVGRLEGSVLEAQGTVHAWHCPTARGYPFPCWEFKSCDSELTLTFTKR